MTEYILFFDGACEPVNPGGVATFGYLIIRDNELVKSGKGVVGQGPEMTNNVAEYNGLLAGLKAVAPLLQAGDSLSIRSDSQLVVRHLTGEYKVRSTRLRPLYERITGMIKEMRERDIQTQIEWVPREENAEADALSHEAFIEYSQKRH